MDPLSITASLIAVTGVASAVTKQLKDLLKNWRDGPDALCALVYEVSDLVLVLEACENAVEDANLVANPLQRSPLPQAFLLLSKADTQLKELGVSATAHLHSSVRGILLEAQQIQESSKQQHELVLRALEPLGAAQLQIHRLKVMVDQLNLPQTAVPTSSQGGYELQSGRSSSAFGTLDDLLLTPHAPMQAIAPQIRVVPLSSDAMNYAYEGELTSLKELFILGRASPYDEDSDGRSILVQAIDGDDPETARFLLSCGAELDHEDRWGMSPEDQAVERVLGSNSHRARWLQFVASCSLDGYGFSTVHKIVLGLIAVDLEQQLASSTAQLNARDRNGRTPLFWAARRGDVHALSILLKYQADLNIGGDSGGTPIHAAAYYGHIRVASMLIDHDINLETKDHRGRTALRVAAESECMEDYGEECAMIELLLRYKAGVNCSDSYGETPLMGAVLGIGNSLRKAQVLLEYGADIDAVNEDGNTALIGSIIAGNRSQVELFLASGADCRTINKCGNSILHIAADWASHDVLDELLIARLKNIDVDRLNSSGLTAEQVAEQERREGAWREEQDWHDKFTLLISTIRHDTEISQGRALKVAMATESAESGEYLDGLAALFEDTEASRCSDKAGSALATLLDDEDGADEFFFDAEE
ncbi:MAG: hypothetical protein M1820_002674 [Bogoriella megaspora]|nr:MAG: hypothetical protein M1820_002674 [Bogoriella megaspora]